MAYPNVDLFKTIHPDGSGTTTDEVIFQLHEMIHRGDLRPGDRLPLERDLARLLGVSRPTVCAISNPRHALPSNHCRRFREPHSHIINEHAGDAATRHAK